MTLEELDAQRITTQLHPYRGRTPDPSKPVAIYRNLHAQTDADRWSIVQGAHVVAHAAAIMLREVRFVVSAKGLARMRRLGKTIVCASARGMLTGSGMGVTATEGPDLPVRVAFDPNLGAFVTRGTRQQILGALVVRFNERGCTAAYTEHASIGRPRQARCPQHTDVPAYTASRCNDCRALRSPPLPPP